MACLRGISKRVNLLQRRLYPFCGHRFGDDKDETKPVSSPNPSTMINKFFPHIGTERLGSVFLERQYNSFVQPLGFGFSSYRYMSSTPAEVPDKVDSIDLVVGTEVVPDEFLESVTSQVAPAIHEVAFAAVDTLWNNSLAASFLNDVHSITGLNWWASIALTSLIISGLTFTPLLLIATKTSHKVVTVNAQLEHLRQEISTWVSDPEAMAKEFEKQKKILYKKFGVNVAALLSLIVIQGGFLVIFSIAVMDMVETVPSFKTGGILWFTDLTTPDSLCILPLLIPVNLLISMKLCFPSDLKGLLTARNAVRLIKARNAVQILMGVLGPLSLFLPSAVHCYLLPTQLFFIVYGLATKKHYMQNKK